MIQKTFQWILFIVSVLFLAINVGAQTCDPSGDCGGDETLGTYDVLSPMGQSSVEMIEMAPRLETLD